MSEPLYFKSQDGAILLTYSPTAAAALAARGCIAISPEEYAALSAELTAAAPPVTPEPPRSVGEYTPPPAKPKGKTK
jgi:hypothetical protein